jgi:hypothetical protein
MKSQNKYTNTCEISDSTFYVHEMEVLLCTGALPIEY